LASCVWPGADASALSRRGSRALLGRPTEQLTRSALFPGRGDV